MHKLLDEYNNTYQHSVNKKPINTDYSALTEKIETNPKAPKFKVSGIAKYKNIFSKSYTEIGRDKYILLILFWKLILGHTKLKI